MGQHRRRADRLDRSSRGAVAFEALHDNGTMGLALLGAPAEHASVDASVLLSESLVGELGRAVKLAAGESTQVTFVVVWHFPNLKLPGIQGASDVGTLAASRRPRRWRITS